MEDFEGSESESEASGRTRAVKENSFLASDGGFVTTDPLGDDGNAADFLELESRRKKKADADRINGAGGSSPVARANALRVMHQTKPHEVIRITASTLPVHGAHFRQELTRRELVRDTGLTPRDIRRIDPMLQQTTNAPAVRRCRLTSG